MKIEWKLIWTIEIIKGCGGVCIELNENCTLHLLIDYKRAYQSRISLN